MATCVFSPDYNKQGFTLVDNAFLDHYLPYADEVSLKVYLYGLRLASTPYCENSEEALCNALDLTLAEVKSAFEFWKDQGLVSFISESPLCVRYNSVTDAFSPNKKYNKDKYADFNDALQSLFPTRMLDRGELERYYDFIEESGFQPEALVLIAKYCIDLKGLNVGYPYILRVAKNWALEGNKTLADVEEKLKETESMSEELREVYKALKKTSAVDLEARQLYLKWKKSLGYSHEAIITAAKTVKKGGMEGLDRLLENYFKQGIYTVEDIKAYKSFREKLFEITSDILKILSLRYERIDYLAENYVAKWLNMGFEGEGLKLIARYCIHVNKEYTFDTLEVLVKDFYEEGVVGYQSIQDYLDGLARNDSIIRKIILATGANREVTKADRERYLIWSANWGFSDDEILEAAETSRNRPHAFSYINGILLNKKNNPVTRVTAREVGAQQLQSSFVKEELKAKLREDEYYLALERELRVTTLEMSKFLANGLAIPAELENKHKELSQKMDERARALGFNPDDLKS